MRIGIGFGFGPFRVSQTLFSTRRRPRRRVWYRCGGRCYVHHRTPGAAARCRSTF